ncbi:MAG TPA: aminotransferase class V-fold PLP-dependent enzyme [Actinomycetota bacterium]|nr:aminotransferase class V-fold PLP-dependent enzyme [Actinomycetota bacterium]
MADAHFPVLDRIAYLNAGAVGPLSSHTHEAMAEAERRSLEDGRGGHGTWQARIDARQSLRERLATLIGVPPTKLAITASTTEGCSIVLGGFGLGPGDEVITSDAEHPALTWTLPATGAVIKEAEVLGRTDAEVIDAVAALVTDRTRLIALSHVLWLNGQVLPIAGIKARTGLPMLVDGAQSVGAIDVDATQADYYTVSGQKWLCGPELTGALYVADPRSLRPRRVVQGEQSHVDPDEAASLELLFHPASLIAGLLAALEDRPADAAERGAAMTAYCRDALLAAGVEVLTAPGQSRLVAFRVPGDSNEAVERCQERGVTLRAVPNGSLRASCGWWNRESDIDRLAEVVRGL